MFFLLQLPVAHNHHTMMLSAGTSDAMGKGYMGILYLMVSRLSAKL